ncbi:MAG: hypothetical protein IKK45_01730 [Akkermansia sp.]|nr:hypothetical protein [Akkermansia sp.]
MNTQEEKAGWLVSLLTGWGIRESWAKIIAGAVIGALCAAGAFCTASCEGLREMSPEQLQVLHYSYHRLTGQACPIVEARK